MFLREIIEPFRGQVKIPNGRMTKTCRESWVMVTYSETYVTSHKKPFALSVDGFGLLSLRYRGSKVCFCEISAMVTNCVTNPL